jgi:DNA mismatch repair protein MutL
MPEIRRLPSALVNRIAAGEVVERPAAALKELVENAIDAGARRIGVVLAEGGLARIEVVDDGCGMSPEAMALALERHATSKLPDALIGPDGAIELVTTLGFRGEALPSIASVARLTIDSRELGAGEGWRRVVDHGALLADEPAALPPGTRVRVEELFAKVPARRKFLRSARSEYAACLDVVRRLAMARPDIAFTLETIGDGAKRTVLNLQAGEELATRVARIIAHELKDNSVPIELERDTPHGVMRLTGVAGLPTWNRGVADHQYLFVNGRPVKDRLLVGAVRGAYADMLARDRHAVLALFLDLPPQDVDVNVHPAKTEVRFRDSAGVRGFIVSGLRQALATGDRRSAQGPDRGAMARWQGGGGGGVCAIPLGSTHPSPTPPRAGRGYFCARWRSPSLPPKAAPRKPRPFPPKRSNTPSASPAGRSPTPISSRKPPTGWCWSISTPPTNASCSNGCAPQGRTRACAVRRRCWCPMWSRWTKSIATAWKTLPRALRATAS